MKKLMTFVVTALSASVLMAMSLADARAQIAGCVKDSSAMTATVKQLSAEDQVAFLTEVNAAITKMPGSNEEKAASLLNANKAALRGAAKGNKTAMLAEIFATVPVEDLPVLVERLSADMFNRAADPSATYTDEQFTEIAKNVMEAVLARTGSEREGAERAALAVVMLLKASNGTPADLSDKLIAMLPEQHREDARKTWIPAALGDSKGDRNYEPILEAAEVDNIMPHNDVVIRIAGPQLLESMLGEIVEGTPTINRSGSWDHPGLANHDETADFIPPAFPIRPDLPDGPKVPEEPRPYPFQYLY